MEISLSTDQARFVHDAVRSGLYSSKEDVVRDALKRLAQALPETSKPRDPKSKRSKSAHASEPLSPAELDERLLAAGLLTQLPDLANGNNDDDPPIVIRGEPLSETIIRDRR